MTTTERMLAGYETVGNYQPIQLYAGEAQPVSTQGLVAAGAVLGQKNARDETYKFPLVALVAGKLVPFNPAGGGGTNILYGILPHAMDTSATGYNADTNSPVFVEGVFNFDALDTAMTYAQAQAAVARTAIVIQKLY